MNTALRHYFIRQGLPLAVAVGICAIPTAAFALSPESLTYYQQAVAFERNGELEQAEQAFRQATAADPNDYLNFVKLASVLGQLGKTQEAISTYHQAAKLNSQDPMIWYSMGALYEQAGDYENAEKVYQAALTRNPAYEFGQLNLARTLILQNKYTEAEGLYEKFLATYPKHYEARKNLANLLLVSKKPADAAREYETLKQNFPERFSDYVNLAKALTRSEAPEKALEELKTAYAREGNKTDIIEETGRAHAALRQYDYAIQNFTKAFESDPQRVELWLSIGELYLQKKEPQNALASYNRYLIAKPENTTVRQMVANLYMETHQHTAALNEFNTLLSDKYNSELGDEARYKVRSQKALALQLNGNTAEAISEYEDLLGNAPQSLTDWQLKLNLALAYHKANQLEAALALYKQVYYSGSLDNLEYDPTTRPVQNYPEGTTPEPTEQKATLARDITVALTALGDKEYQAKNYQQALRHFAEATQFATKENHLPWLGLANTYYALEMNQLAYQQYQKVLTIKSDEVNAQLYSAKLELAEQNHAASLPTLQKLATQYPGNFEIQFSLAQAYTQLGDHQQAVTVYESALQSIRPEDTQTAERLYLGLADSWQALGDKPRALSAFELAAQQNPGNATTQYNMDVLYNEAGNYEQSTTAYQKAIALKPNFADAHYGLAVTFEKQNKLKEALTSYEQYATEPTRRYFQQALGRIETLKNVLNLSNPTGNGIENATENNGN